MDAKRGKLFSRLNKEITVAAREGGGDPDANPRLRTAIEKAKSNNMPKDNIERAVKKGTGELGGEAYEAMVYEGYGPGGVAIMVDCFTDNRNRTAADVRSIFTKGGGNLGENGCVSYLFNRKGLIIYDAGRYTEDQVLEQALEAGASDVVSDDGTIQVTTEPEEFHQVLRTMEGAGFQHESAEIERIADATVSLDEEGTQKVLKLIEQLDEHDDVQSVSSNLEIPDSVSMEM